MSTAFKRCASEDNVIRIGNLESGNRVDRVSLTADVVLTRDPDGAALKKHLQALHACVIKTFETDKFLFEAAKPATTNTVKNPFVPTI